jgi:hypothetical protein
LTPIAWKGEIMTANGWRCALHILFKPKTKKNIVSSKNAFFATIFKLLKKNFFGVQVQLQGVNKAPFEKILARTLVQGIFFPFAFKIHLFTVSYMCLYPFLEGRHALLTPGAPLCPFTSQGAP